jgi:predicted PurR-regulated permease PerM
VIIGLLIMAFMMLTGLPYAAAVAALVGVSALVPMIGVFIGLALGAFLVFAVSPISAVIFAVVGFAIVQIEASVISPRITEQALGIPGIWVLVAITVFGAVWGILGILVGVPTFAALYRLLVQDLDRREARKAAEEDREERAGLASEGERELSAGEAVS